MASKKTAPSAMARGGMRQAMAWLHTWCGLWFSWLLFAVFLTGSLAIFDDPITDWMRPVTETSTPAGMPTLEAANAERGKRLALGIDYMQQAHAGADMWELWPVNRDAGNALDVFWFNSNGGYEDMRLDPRTGAAIVRKKAVGSETLGGHHFVDFHYELHAGTIGLWIIGIAAVVMLVALVSGVITHRRIFKDFFTFRPKKGQRSWLDAHNAVAVLTLPFQCMIAFTGIAISSPIFMPAPMLLNYGSAKADQVQFTNALDQTAGIARSGRPLVVPDLEPYAARAQAIIGQTVRAVVINNPGDATMQIGVYGWNEEADLVKRINGTTGMVLFSAASGEILRVRQPGQADGGVASLTRRVIGSLHMATFGGITLKWLYFVCGLAGTAMMGTGAILFMVKRRGKHGTEFGRVTPRIYGLIEALNLAAIVGLLLACISYFWANRLLPASVEQRAVWELRAFFGVWLLTLLHACVRCSANAWREQLCALATLCLLLPLLNLLTSGDYLLAQIARADWERAGVELMVLTLGGLTLLTLVMRNRRSARPL
ncbi:PepSY domain-containing protein [Glaciimonas sp. PCH181]|uniref:PepSY-associated TM helix domain-containing protein n=1 Tax=Glaciimonas sp. PCH181 TaxID=2133943 RepID=UPI000D3A8800|nr:PepSY-associated TM helix domain-containing protein [Glaciimonas sp. PCH181]PUA20393.1 peptidase [Glaciimonas sp. PCH181]